MPKYNIYKIQKSKQQKLISKLLNSNMEITKIHETAIGYKMIFFLSNFPKNNQVWWQQIYENFIDKKIQNLNYYAAMIIHNSEVCYCISIGKSYHFIKKYCDKNFGMDMASRITDKNKFIKQSSKFLLSKKAKIISNQSFEIENVEDNSSENNNYEFGESIDYIRSQTNNPSIWGKYASFGQSVTFCLDIKAIQLPILIINIEKSLKQKPNFNLPIFRTVSDTPTLDKLNICLIKSFEENNEQIYIIDLLKTYNLSEKIIKEYLLNNTQKEYFNFNKENELKFEFYFFLKKDKANKSQKTILSINNWKNWLDQRNIQINLKNLNNTFVLIKDKNKKIEYKKRFNEFLFFSCRFDDFDKDKNVYFLIKNKWYFCNKKYLKTLNDK